MTGMACVDVDLPVHFRGLAVDAGVTDGAP
jgi:hypothetical protein